MAAPTHVVTNLTNTVETGASMDVVLPNASGHAVGDLIIAAILKDGTTAATPAINAGSSLGIEDIDGTDDAVTILGPYNVGSAAAAQIYLVIGRALVTTAITIALDTTSADDKYMTISAFRDVNTGTTLASIMEQNGTTTPATSAGTSTTVADAGVTTTGADRLALNFVGVNDDNVVGAMTGMTGGTWVDRGQFASATGTDGAMSVQTAAMASAGTIDGGSYTMLASDEWGVVGFALIGTTSASAPSLIWQPAAPTPYRL